MDPSLIIALPCQSFTPPLLFLRLECRGPGVCEFPLIIHGEVVFDVDLSKLQYVLFKVATWTYQCFDLDSSKLHMDFVKIGFVKVVIFISGPLPNKTKPKLELDFEAC